MLSLLARSAAQLGDPALRGVLAKAVALTLLLFAALGAALFWLLLQVDASDWPDLLARIWQATGAILAVPVVLVGGFLLFPAIATAVMSLFLDDVVDAVEARHYPHARATRRAGVAESARLALRSGLRVAGWNLLALPLYLVLLLTGAGAFIAFLVVNGWVLGGDLIDQVVVRHLPPGAQSDWARGRRRERFLLGLTTAAVFLVPVANLLAPILGTAMATHLYHRSKVTADAR